MQITFPALQSISDAVSAAFNTQFFSAPTVYDKFTTDTTSIGAETLYPRVDMLPGKLREWLGDRVVHSLSLSTFTIRNKTFEQTIAIRREDLEDDQAGLLTAPAQQLGANAAHLPDLLIAGLLKNGMNVATYDGQNFFDTAHPNPTPTGAAGTIGNYVAGSGPAWYLLYNGMAQKAFVYQKRRPFVVTPMFSMTDEVVFNNQEFRWGVDGRCNAGYGIWQFAYMSEAPMTVANIIAAQTAMASIRRPDGAPMGVVPDMLLVPTALWPDANAYYVNDFIPIDSVTGATTLAPNPIKGMFKPLQNMWLN